MKLKLPFYSLYLFLTSVWWGWTILVDMVVVRILFSRIDDIFVAGSVGMELFSKLNQLEIVFSTAILIITILRVQAKKPQFFDFVLALLIWVISMVYFSYLTPKLITLTQLWKASDLQGIISAPGIPDIQQEHQFFHNLYIGLDSLKLLLLTLMIGTAFWRREKWS